MKLINKRLAAHGLTAHQAGNLCSMNPRLTCRFGGGPRDVFSMPYWNVYFRETGDEVLSGDVTKQLPRWAKPNVVKGIGHKVTAFYRKNNAVICDTFGPAIGSDEWLIMQDSERLQIQFEARA